MNHLKWAVGAGLLLACAAGTAQAQGYTGGGRSPLLDLPRAQLRAEVESRYGAAVQLTQAREIVAANDSRFLWASEAKVACGIAIGHLKAREVDEDSVNKCDEFSRRMMMTPQPYAPPQRPGPETTPGCAAQQAFLVYFEWDVSTLNDQGREAAASTANQIRACGYNAVEIVGHTDTSGSNAYNDRLSQARAVSVADALVASGVPASAIAVGGRGETAPAVQTGDGVREPMNRRAEVTARR